MSDTRSDFSQALWAAITAHPDKMFWCGRDLSFRYFDLARNICAVTEFLNNRGIRKGDIALIIAGDDWPTFCVWVGCILNGVVAVLLPSGVWDERARHIFGVCEPDCVITGTDPRWRALFSDVTAPVVTDADIFASQINPKSTQPSLSQAQSGEAYILFTSGSTSTPKGVVVSHDSLAAQMETLTRVLAVDEDSKIFNGLVLHHVDGLIQGPVLAAWCSAMLIRPGKHTPDRIEQDMSWLAATSATHLIAAPTLLELIDRSCIQSDYFSHPEFVAVLSSSAKLSAPLWDSFEKRFSVQLINEYGMTETVAASHFAGPFPEMGARHTIGVPIDCEARLANEDGLEVNGDCVGELQIKGRNVFTRYFKDEARTRATFLDGWFCTGDLAKIDQSGSYTILGRRDETINFGGYRIQPDEIDETILKMQDVTEAKTIGVAHDMFGQVPVSAYVARRSIVPEDVLEFCRTHLEQQKVPKKAIQLSELPRTGTGKPDLGALAKLVSSSKQTVVSQSSEICDSVLGLAAEIFGAPRESLSSKSAPDTVAGWDSYAHTTLVLEAERAFEIELPVAEAMAAECLQDLIDLITKSMPVSVPRTPITLRQVRAGCGDEHLVFLPGLSGQMAYISNLVASLSSDVSIHAVSVDPDQVEWFAGDSMQDLGEKYANSILAADFNGPLFLFGASFGGFLAYETAHFLRGKQRDVRGIVLNDTAVPWPHRRTRHLHRVAHMFHSFRHRRTVDSERGPDASNIDYVVPGYGRLNLKPLHPRCHDMSKQSFLTLSKYKPSNADFDMLVFSAAHRKSSRIPVEPHLGWKRFNRGSVQTIPLGESHFSVLGDASIAAQAAEKVNAFIVGLRAG